VSGRVGVGRWIGGGALRKGSIDERSGVTGWERGETVWRYVEWRGRGGGRLEG